LNSGPWENPRSETDNLHARKGYVKRTLKMLNTISDEKNATIEYPKDLVRELSPPAPHQLLNDNSSLLSANLLKKFQKSPNLSPKHKMIKELEAQEI
jgi:hypothetical protein